MKEITIGFSTSKKKLAIASWAIMFYQNTKFSHTYLRETLRVFKDDLIIHASEGSVQRMSQYQFDKKHKVVEEYIITIENRETYQKMKDIMHKHSGARYSVLQNVGILYVDLMNSIFNKNVKNPWQKGWNCSELVAVVLNEMFPKYFDKYDPNTITPKQVNIVLKKLADKNLIKKKPIV